jgi:hydrogenase maturation protease
MSEFIVARSAESASVPLALRTPRILVIGYGNPGRQDDGLGPAAAAEIGKLFWPSVTTCDNYQLVIEDAVQIANHDVVWFVDATRDGDAPCVLRRLSAAFDIAFTSHLVKPEVLLAITERCYGKSPESHLVGIRGYESSFSKGSLIAREAIWCSPSR